VAGLGVAVAAERRAVERCEPCDERGALGLNSSPEPDAVALNRLVARRDSDHVVAARPLGVGVAPLRATTDVVVAALASTVDDPRLGCPRACRSLQGSVVAPVGRGRNPSAARPAPAGAGRSRREARALKAPPDRCQAGERGTTGRLRRLRSQPTQPGFRTAGRLPRRRRRRGHRGRKDAGGSSTRARARATPRAF
jgi:hypothetical protein